MTPDRGHAAIAMAGKREDGSWHVEVVEHESGTKWVAKRLAKLVRKHEPAAVRCDSVSPAASLLSDLEHQDVDVTTVNAQEHARACGLFYDAVMDGTLWHRGDPSLTAAVEAATKHNLGDAGSGRAGPRTTRFVR